MASVERNTSQATLGFHPTTVTMAVIKTQLTMQLTMHAGDDVEGNPYALLVPMQMSPATTELSVEGLQKTKLSYHVT